MANSSPLVMNEFKKIKRVAIVGTTQSGKSTFLRLVHEYAGATIPDDLKIGDGNVSCTTHPKIYDITTTLKLYKVFNKSERGKLKAQHNEMESVENSAALNKAGVTANDYQNYIDSQEYDVSTEPINISNDQLQFHIIDTPGLDEDNDKDEDHILNILDMFEKEREITAVIFIVNYTVPFSAGFIRFFRYYRYMVPGLSNKFLIVHSRCSLADRVIEDMGNDPLKKRKDAFEKKCLNDDSEILNIQHFFIDSTPKKIRMQHAINRIKYGFEMALTYQVLTNILLAIQSMIDTPMSNLTYRKSDTVRAVDESVMSHCKGLREGYLKALDTYNKGFSKQGREISGLTAKIADLKASIASKEQRLKEIDNATEVEVARDSKRNDFSFFSNWWPATELTVNSEFTITRVSATALQDNKVDFETKMTNNNKTATVTAKARWGNHSYVSIAALTTNAIKFKDEINTHLTELSHLKMDLKSDEAKLENYTNESQNINQQRQTLQQYLEAIGKLETAIQKDSYTLSIYRQIRKLDLTKKVKQNVGCHVRDYTDVLGLPRVS